MVSATVPNIADVAQWVGSMREARNPAKTYEVLGLVLRLLHPLFLTRSCT